MLITLSSPVSVEFDSLQNQASSSAVQPNLSIEHLPPISLTMVLPETYPLIVVPSITKIQALIPSSSGQDTLWLNRKSLNAISRKLGEMWDEEKEMSGEGQGVLWRFWEWVGTGDFLSDLDLMRSDSLR